MELVVMLGNVYRGASDSQVGFEDAEQTIDMLMNKLNKMIHIKTSDIESCLWSCNLMDEQGRFWHPQGLTFDEFLKKMLRGDKFDKTYNLIEIKDRNK